MHVKINGIVNIIINTLDLLKKQRLMIHDKIVMLSRACTPYKAVAGPGFNLRGRGVDFVNGVGVAVVEHQ